MSNNTISRRRDIIANDIEDQRIEKIKKCYENISPTTRISLTTSIESRIDKIISNQQQQRSHSKNNQKYILYVNSILNFFKYIFRFRY